MGVPDPPRFVVATANPDKAAEITAILGAVLPGVVLVPRPADVPEVDETGETLEDNARLKAVALVEATGLPAIADDTGLEVDALDGAPGVYTARFAGPDAPTPTTSPRCCVRSTASRPRGGPPGSGPPRSPGGPTAAKWSASASSRAR